ncbi:hypothetical protein [Clostridium tertium]
MFNEKELEWIKELVEDKVAKMKENGDYNYFKYDKEIFESILDKIEKSK